MTDELKRARDDYMPLLKRDEPELTAEERALARESFREGWIQHENRTWPGQWR
jgi:hypothetical protein